jgi:hypothetical protein
MTPAGTDRDLRPRDRASAEICRKNITRRAGSFRWGGARQDNYRWAAWKITITNAVINDFTGRGFERRGNMLARVGHGVGFKSDTTATWTRSSWTSHLAAADPRRGRSTVT